MNGHARGNRPRVVIIGAGFGGLWAARGLAGKPVSVTVLDRNNYHTFLPLLYQVAAAELEPEEITYPVRGMLRHIPGVRFSMSEVSRIDLPSKSVYAGDRIFSYDYLVVAGGTTSHFFGVPGAAEHTFPLKTIEEGIVLRNRILSRFEKAAGSRDPGLLKRALTFVIIGGGATGVEYAGALIELIKGPFVKDYPEIDFRHVRLILLEGTGRLLSSLPEKLGEYAGRRLSKLGVSVRTGLQVTRVTKEGVLLQDGSSIDSETVIWTAGITGSPFLEQWGLPADEHGRAAVYPTLQLPGHPEVYVVGDLLEKPHPMLAPVAIQQGTAAAENIGRQLRGEKPVPFSYRDRGTMVVIGRNAAVAHIGERAYTGFFAWILWLVVHIIKLMGFRNRLLVLINWAWDYFFFERAVKIILPTTRLGGAE
ncbi:MAG: FAD-dependent oxidoreductase [Deltaproteobacteria bacterium]|nr:FAD-dependent oxidoreductase [Deltaproteobacteria bacterium]NIS77694.1 FAD-dependent oxidoreductase [Deltaproteobacteria bacterium]